MSTPEDVGGVNNLPAGFFVFNAKVQLSRPPGDTQAADVQCVLRVVDANATPFVFDTSTASVSGDSIVLPLATAAEQGMDGGSAVLNCKGPNFTASNVTIVAILVGHLDLQ